MIKLTFTDGTYEYTYVEHIVSFLPGDPISIRLTNGSFISGIKDITVVKQKDIPEMFQSVHHAKILKDKEMFH